ncbi:DUF3443 family protein [Paraburkholderia sp. A1RI-2L]|uniref:DUF3443 family protein n=1 Tax=Paraburkholderia sp. A1RI-2L TaxID=3028367 RepID=UPI003B77E10A
MNKIMMVCALSASMLLAGCGGGGDGPAVSNSTAAGASAASDAASGGASGGKSPSSGGSGGSGSGGSSSGGSGSGGSGSGGSSSGGSGSGGSGSGGSGSGTSDSGSGTSSGGDSVADIGNTIPVLVSSASAVRNFPLVSVTVCQPGSGAQTNCATIDNVLLDTGSFGLRLYASAIPASTLAALPVQTDPASGKNVAACGAFGSGYTWGSLRAADVKLAREVAPDVPIQVIGDAAIASPAPASCVWNTALTSPAVLGANGVLGVGVARYDCGAACTRPTPRTGYYYADTGLATPISMPLANQVTNPVALFPVDNNGVIVDTSAIAADGAPTATGTVIFGIGTQANNQLAGAGATVLATDRWGNFKGSVGNGSTVQTFIDSGSNTLSFEDWSIIQDKGFYVPATPLKRSVALSDTNGATGAADIVIGNADAMFASLNFAFSTLATFLAQTVDLGMPFFYGRRIYYGIEGTSSGAGVTGPYVAYLSR